MGVGDDEYRGSAMSSKRHRRYVYKIELYTNLTCNKNRKVLPRDYAEEVRLYRPDGDGYGEATM